MNCKMRTKHSADAIHEYQKWFGCEKSKETSMTSEVGAFSQNVLKASALLKPGTRKIDKNSWAHE